MSDTDKHEALEEFRRNAWVPGMVARNGSRYLGPDPSTGEMIFADPAPEGGQLRWVWPRDVQGPGWEPDLDDRATRALRMEEVAGDTLLTDALLQRLVDGVERWVSLRHEDYPDSDLEWITSRKGGGDGWFCEGPKTLFEVPYINRFRREFIVLAINTLPALLVDLRKERARSNEFADEANRRGSIIEKLQQEAEDHQRTDNRRIDALHDLSVRLDLARKALRRLLKAGKGLWAVSARDSEDIGGQEEQLVAAEAELTAAREDARKALLHRAWANGESCPVCGDTPVVLTTVEQDGGEWLAYDGAEATCLSCGAVGGVTFDEEDGAWINWDDDHPATVAAYKAEEKDDES